MEKEQLLNEIENFKNCIDKYVTIFMQNYPTEETKKSTYAPENLLELAIEAQSILAIFGSHATKRFKYIGFFELFYFDNPVDWHAWKYKVIEKNIDFSGYASITFRIDAEIERMKVLLNKDLFQTYENLTTENYLVSKNKYFNQAPVLEENKKTDDALLPNIHINIIQNDENEKKALQSTVEEKELDSTHKKVSIFSNSMNIFSKFMGLL